MQKSSSGAFNLFNKSAGVHDVLQVATAEQKEEAVRVLAAGNALIGLVSSCVLVVSRPTDAIPLP